MRTIVAAAIFTASLAAQPLHADGAPPAARVVVNPDVGVPVFPNDITDRPYVVIGPVKAGVRKHLFSGEASQVKLYRELWERAAKLGADAVVNARYGDPHVSAFSFNKTNATGTAVKFTGAAR